MSATARQRATGKFQSVRGASFAALATLVASLATSACGTNDERPKSPRDAAAYNLQLGMAYLQRGELAFAREKIERALQQDPENVDVQRAAALLYDRMGEDDRADKHYSTVLRLKPAEPEALNNYGVFLCRHGKIEKGERMFEQAAKSPFNRAPENAYANAGNCMRGAKRLDEAIRHFEAALASNPKYRPALLQLAEISFERGRMEETRLLVLRHLESAGSTAEILWLGVRVERALGNITAANAYARRLKTEYPTAEQTRALIASERKTG